MDKEKDTSGFHSFGSKNSDSVSLAKLIIFVIVFILLGIGTGYVAAQKKSNAINTNNSPSQNSNPDNIQKGQVYGSTDTSTFKDVAEGILKPGGSDGEGQFHIERPGGDSQNVYLTSSSVDLSKFVNHKIKVHGATQTAKHVGWLMDVGQVEVLE